MNPLLKAIAGRVVCAFIGGLAVVALLAFWIVTSRPARAGNDDLLFTQRNSTDTSNILRIPPHSTGWGMFCFDGAGSLLPSWCEIGSGLSVTSGTLNTVAAAPSWTDITGKPTFATVATSGSYNDLTNKPTIPAAQIQSDWNQANTSALDYIKNKPALSGGTVTSITAGAGLSGGTITSSGTISMPNTGTAGAYSGVTTDAQGRVTAGTVRSFNYTTRSLNTCFQVSSTRDALVSYSVDILTSLSLTAGQQGTVYLRTYTNSGCSTGAQELTRFVNGQTGTLTIGLALSQNVTGTLTGVVPGGLWVQLVTENNTGTPTFTARPGQETLL